MDPGERNIEVVRGLNSIFERIDFRTLRDDLETSESSELAENPELGELYGWIVEVVDPEVEVEFHLDSPLVEGGRFVGLDGWTELWRNWLAAWDDYALIHSNYEASGDYVLVDAVHQGRGRASGLETELPQAQLWKLHEGKVRSCRIYATRAQAIRAMEGR